MDTRESEPLNGASMFEQHRDQVREIYTSGIAEIMDRCMDEFVLPADRLALLRDAAQFVIFLIVVKAVEVSGQPIDKRSLLAAYWPIEKDIKRELQGMLLQYASANAAQPATQGETK